MSRFTSDMFKKAKDLAEAAKPKKINTEALTRQEVVEVCKQCDNWLPFEVEGGWRVYDRVSERLIPNLKKVIK